MALDWSGISITKWCFPPKWCMIRDALIESKGFSIAVCPYLTLSVKSSHIQAYVYHQAYKCDGNSKLRRSRPDKELVTLSWLVPLFFNFFLFKKNLAKFFVTGI